MTKKFSGAFTLSELLMSVLVVSIILVAMAPVITKRTSDNISVNAVKYEGRLFTYSTTDNDCQIEKDANGNPLDNVICNYEIPAGVNNINIIAVSGGGGGGGHVDMSEDFDPVQCEEKTLNFRQEKQNKTLVDGTIKEVSINIPSRNVVYIDFDLKSQGGGGGGSWAFKQNGVPPTSQSQCDPYNALYVETDSENKTGICITKYNVGDILGPKVASSKQTVFPTQKCLYSSSCCFSGSETSNPETCNNKNGYSACDRSVCYPSVIESSCLNWAPEGTEAGDWQLPTSSEITLAGLKALDLCTSSTSSGELSTCQEYNIETICQNANAGTSSSNKSYGCAPNYVFVADTTTSSTGSTQKYFYNVNGQSTGSLVNYTQYSYYPVSGRCVLRKFNERYTAAIGGGGAGGNRLEDFYDMTMEEINSILGGRATIQISYQNKVGINSLEYGTLPKSVGFYTFLSLTESTEDLNKLNKVGQAKAVFYDSQNELKYGLYLLPGNSGSSKANANFVNLTGIKSTVPKGGENTNDYDYSIGYYTGFYHRASLNKDNWNNLVMLVLDKNFAGNVKSGLTGKDGAILLNGSKEDVVNQSNTLTRFDSKDGVGLAYENTLSGGRAGYFRKNSTTGELESVAPQDSQTLAEAYVGVCKVDTIAGGGGGQGGAFFKAENIAVQPTSTIQIKVGKGGEGGLGTYKYNYTTRTYEYKNMDGKNGGTSGFIINNSNQILISGGTGGSGGKRFIGGTEIKDEYLGQARGNYSVNCNGTNTTGDLLIAGTEKSLLCGNTRVFLGQLGNNAKYIKEGGEYIATSGGKGGDSHTGAKGGCGGATTEDNAPCTNAQHEGMSGEFVLPSYIGGNSNYGMAGAGGGGAGWSIEYAIETTRNSDGYFDFRNAKGGNGANGYVYVYWVKVE